MQSWNNCVQYSFCCCVFANVGNRLSVTLQVSRSPARARRERVLPVTALKYCTVLYWCRVGCRHHGGIHSPKGDVVRAIAYHLGVSDKLSDVEDSSKYSCEVCVAALCDGLGFSHRVPGVAVQVSCLIVSKRDIRPEVPDSARGERFIAV